MCTLERIGNEKRINELLRAPSKNGRALIASTAALRANLCGFHTQIQAMSGSLRAKEQSQPP